MSFTLSYSEMSDFIIMGFFLRLHIIFLVCSCSLAISAAPDTNTTDVVIMTYNIRHGTDADNLDQLDKIGQFIREQNPDFVGLQEVDQHCTRSGNVDQMKRLAELTGMHPAFASHMPFQGGEYGVGILSRYPLTNVENHRISLLKDNAATETRALLTATATLPDFSHVTFATAHFALDQPSRLFQTKETLNVLSEDHALTIFTGDLNTTPSAPEIASLKTALIDCDTKDQLTFPVPRAVKKIDYIFVNRESVPVIQSVTVLPSALSDHFPVVTRVHVNLLSRHGSLK